MRKLSAICGPGLAAIVLAWSVSAPAQSVTIELIEANLAATPQQAAVSRGEATSDSLKHGANSDLRMATRSSGAMQARDHLNARPFTAGRGSGAIASARCQSEIAEHRQERRGATAAGKPGTAGKGGKSG
jgi:hypothetical protein